METKGKSSSSAPSASADISAYLDVLDTVRETAKDTSESFEGADFDPRLRVAKVYNQVERVLLQAMADRTPVRRLDPSRAALEQKAIEAILSGTEWLTGDEVGVRHNARATNKHAAVSRWVEGRKVFAIEHTGRRLFARYQFDQGWKPLPAIATILKIMHGYSPYRIAGWFESTNGYLSGRRPREVIGEDPNKVVEAARDHVAGPLHG